MLRFSAYFSLPLLESSRCIASDPLRSISIQQPDDWPWPSAPPFSRGIELLLLDLRQSHTKFDLVPSSSKLYRVPRNKTQHHIGEFCRFCVLTNSSTVTGSLFQKRDRRHDMKAPKLLFSGTMLPLKKRLKTTMTAYDGHPPLHAFRGRCADEARDC